MIRDSNLEMNNISKVLEASITDVASVKEKLLLCMSG